MHRTDPAARIHAWRQRRLVVAWHRYCPTLARALPGAGRLTRWPRRGSNLLRIARGGVLRAHGGIGAAARECDAIERHALNAAAEELGLLGRDGAGVDAHPGDLRRQAPVFDFRAAVHHDLDAVRFRELRRLVAADAELHPDHLRAR